MPERVDGFAQIHVSGTGGGPKYGNILVMPFVEGMDRTSHIDYRLYEHISLGYYDTRFRESGIRSEVTTASRASMYRFTYPAESARALAIDAGFFLGESPVPDARDSSSVPRYRYSPTTKCAVIHASEAAGTMDGPIPSTSMPRPTVPLCVLLPGGELPYSPK